MKENFGDSRCKGRWPRDEVELCTGAALDLNWLRPKLVLGWCSPASMKLLPDQRLLTMLCVMHHTAYIAWERMKWWNTEKVKKYCITFSFHLCNYPMSIPIADSMYEISFLLSRQIWRLPTAFNFLLYVLIQLCPFLKQDIRQPASSRTFQSKHHQHSTTDLVVFL